MERVRQRVLPKDHEAIRLEHIGGNLGQQAVGSEADGTAQSSTNLANLLLDGVGELDGTFQFAFAPIRRMANSSQDITCSTGTCC